MTSSKNVPTRFTEPLQFQKPSSPQKEPAFVAFICSLVPASSFFDFDFGVFDGLQVVIVNSPHVLVFDGVPVKAAIPAVAGKTVAGTPSKQVKEIFFIRPRLYRRICTVQVRNQKYQDHRNSTVAGMFRETDLSLLRSQLVCASHLALQLHGRRVHRNAYSLPMTPGSNPGLLDATIRKARKQIVRSRTFLPACGSGGGARGPVANTRRPGLLGQDRGSE